MKLIEFTDSDGYKHLKWVKDDDLNNAAGIPSDPPDLDQLDWDEIKRDIYNRLVEQRLISWQDIQKKQNAVTGIILAVLRRQIIALYRIGVEENG